DGAAGIAEYHLYTLIDECLENDFGPGHQVGGHGLSFEKTAVWSAGHNRPDPPRRRPLRVKGARKLEPHPDSVNGIRRINDKISDGRLSENCATRRRSAGS